MIWAAMSSAGVGPLCFIKSTVNTAIYQEILEHFSFLLLTSFMEMLISFSSRTLAPAHTAKTTSKCFADHDITVLDRPVNMPDLNPIRYLWDNFKRKMRNSGSNNTDELKSVPQVDRSDTALMLKSVLKEPWSSIECRNEHTSKNLISSVLLILFFFYWS